MKKGLKYSLIGVGVIIFITLVVVIILIGKSVNDFFNAKYDNTPKHIEYRNAEDLYRITAIKFPEVVPVDSTYYDGETNYGTTVKFVLENPEDKNELIQSIEEMIKTDSLYWKKYNDEYEFFVRPELPIDLPNGKGWRLKENGDLDEDGDFISVSVPEKVDTIVLIYGWER